MARKNIIHSPGDCPDIRNRVKYTGLTHLILGASAHNSAQACTRTPEGLGKLHFRLQNNRIRRQQMNEEVLIQLLQDINRENVRFGTVEVSFTFHDGRPTSYELCTHRRRNLDSITKSSDHHLEEDADGSRKR